MPDPAEGRPALDDSPVDVGARVRALRTERGLSLSELARRAAVGKATLSGLEAGTRNPTLDTLYALTTALGLPLTALVAGPGPVRGAAAELELLRVFDDAAAVYELYRMHLPVGGEQRSPAHHAGGVRGVAGRPAARLPRRRGGRRPGEPADPLPDRKSVV